LDDVVNKMGRGSWPSENQCVIHEKVHHAPRITVWVAISSHGLLGPIFFEEAANSVILNTSFTEDKSPCNGLSFCMLVSSIVIEIKILSIDQILDHFMHHPV
jgi:hypothetical protein